MLGNYLQQTTSADDIFRCIFFLGALRVNSHLTRICSSFMPHIKVLGGIFFVSVCVHMCVQLRKLIFLTIILFLLLQDYTDA